jgi:DNA-binding transcriptional LysR family regulator
MDRFKTVESFVAVAKSGSYSRAAKQLGVSRALMSRRIIELETRLGVRLFNRNTHRLSLTDAGTAYFADCQSVLDNLETAERSLLEKRQVAKGNLRILTSQTFGIVQLGSATAAFMQAYPDIDVFVMTSYLSDMSIDLTGGGYDLAIHTSEMADSSLIARKIAPLKWYIVAAPSYLAKHGMPRSLQDLGQHRCMVTGNEPLYHWQFQSAAGTETVKISGIPISNLTTITQDATIAGLGISVLPEYCIAPDLASGALVRLFPEFRAKDRWIRAVYLKERSLPLKTQLFIQFMIDRFKRPAWSAAQAAE